MLIDRLRQISKSYTVYVPSTYTDIFGTGTYGTGNLDRNLAANNLNEVLEGTTWLDVATNGYQNSNIDATIAIKNDGTLWSWGYSDATRPMTAGTINKSSPSQVGSDIDWRNVYGGSNDGSFFAIKTNNTLWAWGRNSNGILGNNNTSSQASPVLIGSGYSSASIGSSHTMSIRTDGTLWGWGLNNDGQLGNGEANSLLKKIDNGFDWQQVSCGDSHTMGIKTDGTLWGWGSNSIGKLGDNSTISRTSPLQVIGGGNWKTVSANRSTTMAIKTNGSMWGWGEGLSYRMGTGVVTDRSSPVQVGADTNWDIVSIGIEFGHAIKTTGTLWAWGLNTSGQLGDNTITTRSVPTQIGVDTNWKDVHQGINFTIGLKTDGTLWSWGSDTNSYGVLGNGVAGSSRSTPTQIGIDTDWDFISSGDYNCSAIKTDGTLWTWGLNSSGQLGDNTTANRSALVQIGTDMDWLKVNVGIFTGSFTFAIKTDATLWSWGDDTSDKLVQRTVTGTHRSSPVLIGYLPYSWSSVSVGGSHVMAITDTNELYTNPIGTSFVMGITPNKSSPNQVGSDTNWKYVFGGNRVTYATKTDNTLWHWGFDIMTRSNDLIISPTQIGTDSNWKSLAVCYTSTFESVIATKTNGTLWAWGNNVYGQLGDNSTVAKTSPVQIGSDTDWDDVFNFNLGGAVSLAIKTNGTLWIWGSTGTYDLLLDINNQQFNRSSPVQLRNGQWKKFAKNGAMTLAGISINDTLHTAGYQNYNLGNSPFRITSPKQIGETLTNIKSISSHQDTGFYIKSNGTLWGWGLNSSGQIGNNNKATEPTPVQIGGDTNWLKVDAGYSHTMAIKSNGSLWGWGTNVFGQLGDNTLVSKSSPVQIGVDTDWSIVSSGVSHTMAIKTTGTLWGWGFNTNGKIGDNTTANRSAPAQIGVDTDWSKISLGGISSLAIKTNGSLWGWGLNTSGELGDNTTANRSVPTQIGTDTDWSKISLGTPLYGSQSSFARKTDGTLWVWGTFSSGNLGTYYIRNKFFKVPKPFSATMISTSINTSGGTALIIDNNSRLWSWGLGTSYQLGDITSTSKNEAVLVDNNSVWSKISSGFSHSMGIKTTGTIWGWGVGTSGRLGLNNNATQTSPVQVGVDNDWLEISIRNSNSYAIKTTGTIWGWGLGASGQVGDNNVITRSTPAQIGVGTDWSKVSAGDGYCMAIKTTGTLWGWGFNTNGKIGDNTTANRSAPAQIGVDTDWSIVSSGVSHTMAIKTTGTLWGWGFNTNGRIGDNTTANRSVPTQIGTDTNWSKISAGSTHTLAVRTNGTLWAWGINTNYQMGIATLTTVDDRSSPVQVGSDSDWSDVFAGLSYSIAVKSNGSIYSTGDGNVLGTGYSGVISRSSPVQLGFDSDWGDLPSKICTNQTIVKKTNGSLWGWGLNTSGQLGDNTLVSRSSPVQLSSETDFNEIFNINFASIFTRSQTL